MNLEEVRKLLGQLQRGLGQRSVALECHCENLETVYVSLTRAGDVHVCDKGATFGYLGRGTDAVFRPIEELDTVEIAKICEQAGVKLRCEDPEAYPRIECPVNPDDSMDEAIARVADAVDRVFEFSYLNRSK